MPLVYLWNHICVLYFILHRNHKCWLRWYLNTENKDSLPQIMDTSGNNFRVHMWKGRHWGSYEYRLHHWGMSEAKIWTCLSKLQKSIDALNLILYHWEVRDILKIITYTSQPVKIFKTDWKIKYESREGLALVWTISVTLIIVLQNLETVSKSIQNII